MKELLAGKRDYNQNVIIMSKLFPKLI